MRRQLRFAPPPALPVAVGATDPDPGGTGALVWSTIEEALLVWDGAQWLATWTYDTPEPPQNDATYVFTQLLATDTWVVVHGLNKFPSVTVIDSAGSEVRGDVQYDSPNQVTLRFAYEFSGQAFCN